MIYLNNAATSYPKPKSVINELISYLDAPPHHHARGGFEPNFIDSVNSCRKNLASMFNIKDPYRFVFTSGSTEALNLAILGLNLNNAHVITTEIEHNSVIRPLKMLERKGIIELTFAPCDSHGRIDVESIAKNITKKTGLIVANHASNVTGAFSDIETIVRLAKERGVFTLIDASQSAGSIEIDLSSVDPDFCAFAGHKNLFGMPGIGALYIRDGVDLKPLKFGGTGVRSDLLYQPLQMPFYYEAGTLNVPGIVSLDAGIKFVREITIEEISRKKRKLVSKMIDGIRVHERVELYGPAVSTSDLSMFCFNIKGKKPEETSFILEYSFGIITRSGLHCAPLIHQALGTYPYGSVRVSPSYFTSEEEARSFIEAVHKISDSIKKP